MSVNNNPKRANGHGFKPGESGNPAGRPKGSQNKTSAALKEAILLAAEFLGDQRANAIAIAQMKKLRKQGIDATLEEVLEATPSGLVAFLIEVFQADYKVAGSLLGRVLPLVLQGDAANPIQLEVKERAERFTTLMASLVDRAERARMQ